MQHELYRMFGKRTPKVEFQNPEVLKYEAAYPRYAAKLVDWVTFDYEVGLEVEVERIRAHHNPVNYPIWQTRADGSLRDNGMEYVSYPIRGQRIHYAINQFFGEVDKGFHFSPRTSIHVHLNALDMYPTQIAGTLLTYMPFEKMLFRFVGGDRESNNFCVPMTDVMNFNFLKAMVQEGWKAQNLEMQRYLALNIDALRKFGSLEFRHMGGTSDKVKLAKWINLIFCLKKYAMANEWSIIKDRISGLNTTSAYAAFFNDVFGPCAYYLDSSNLKRDMEGAVSRIKKLVLNNEWHHEITRGINAEHTWMKALAVKRSQNDMFVTFGARRVEPRARPERVPEGQADRFQRQLAEVQRQERQQRADRILDAQYFEPLVALELPPLNVAAPPANPWRELGLQVGNFDLEGENP